MRTKLVDVGNSKGIRIPKPLREEAGLKDEVDMKIRDGGLFIKPARKSRRLDAINPELRAAMVRSYGPGYSALAKDWDTPEEDEAWAYLQ